MSLVNVGIFTQRQIIISVAKEQCIVCSRCKEWVINNRRADLEKYSSEHLHNCYTLCANHFEDKQFMNYAKRKFLIHNAVPTTFDVPNPQPLLTPKITSNAPW